MYINFVTLLLAYVILSFTLQAFYVFEALEEPKAPAWASSFFALALLGLIGGFYMVFTWPIPGSYNIIFGEPVILLAVFQLAAAFNIYYNYSLMPVGALSAIAGIIVGFIGYRIIDLELTIVPVLSGLGFLTTGLVGILTPPLLHWRDRKSWRKLYGIVCIIPVLIWLVFLFMAYWGHLNEFQDWQPNHYQETVDIKKSDEH